MRKLVLLVFLAVLLLSACTADTEPAISFTDNEGNTLVSYTLRQIKAMPSIKGYAGTVRSSGEIDLPSFYEGVPLATLVANLEGFNEDMGIKLIASDGYDVTLKYAQIMNGSVEQFDPNTGEPLAEPLPVTVILAYAKDKKKLDKEQYGKLLLAVVSETPGQVVQSSWRINNIVSASLTNVVISNNVAISLEDIMPQLYGEVTNPIPLTEVNLKRFKLVNTYVEDDQGHVGEYFGFLLSDLLSYAQPSEQATTLEYTNVEGWTTQVFLDDLANCSECMISMDPDGRFSMVMPGLADEWWLEGVVLLEVK